MAKNGPKYNLVPGQEKDLNKMFYRDYMTEYFDEKIIILTDLLEHKNDLKQRLTASELTIGNLKFGIEEKTVENEKIDKFAKCEIVDTYYHCIETFMRIFIAHASFGSCPLIELTALDTHSYHKKLNKIAEGDFSIFNDRYSSKDTILLTILGIKEDDELLSENQINNLKEWIIFGARELKRMNEYNSFKHGLSMFMGKGSIKISNENGTISKEGDAVHILESKEEKNQYKFRLTNIFCEFDYKVILISFYNELIKNIISIGNFQYVTHDPNTKINGVHFTEFDIFQLRDLFNQKKDLGKIIERYEMPLIYEDDLKK